MNDTQYTYYAFVSHSHRDARWADWIWRALERYRLPSNVRKDVPRPLPKKLQPVFLDKADLGSGNLVDGLYKELKASRYLIVLCSPDSARPNAEGSHYVETEVRHFVELGRADQIIPVIVSGTPETAFCPALKELGILAIDATKFPRQRVLNDVVSKILGLRPDELWRREQRRRRKNAIVWAALGLILMLVSILGGMFVWDNWGLHIGRFADYVRPYGIPLGVGPLTVEQVAHREYHYRFEYRGRRGWFGPRIVRRVTRVNSSDHQTEDNKGEFPERPLSMRISYSDTKQTYANLDTIDFLGKFGRVMVRFDYFGAYNQTIKLRNILLDGSESATGRRSALRIVGGLGCWESIMDDISPEMPSRYGSVATILINRDARGFSKSECYFDSQEEPAAMGDGVCGRKNIADQTGHVVASEFCDASGRPTIANHGIVKRTYAYDEGGFLSRIENISTNGLVAGCRIMSKEFLRDKWGNVTNVNYLSTNGDLHGWSYHYNSHGNCCRELPQVDLGNSRLGSLLTYNEMGYATEITYIDRDGNVTTNNLGVSTVTCSYNELGHRIRMRTFGFGGVPCPMSHVNADLGIFDLYGVEIVFERNGGSASLMFLGPTGKRMCVPNSYCAGMKVDFDGSANISKIRFCKEDLSFVDVKGIAGFNYSYDVLGRPQMISAVDINDKIKSYQNMFGGCAAARFKTDRNGSITNVVFLDEQLTPKEINGMAGYDAVYYDNGTAAIQTFFDTNGVRRLCQYFTKLGYNYAARFYDANGKPDEDCYELVECNDGGYSVLDAKGEKRAYILSVDRVVPGSVAATNGICAGDFVCAVNDTCLEERCGCRAARAIDSTRDAMRVIVFARKMRDRYEFKSVQCGPDPVGFFKKHMGLRFDEFRVLRNTLLDWSKKAYSTDWK